MLIRLTILLLLPFLVGCNEKSSVEVVNAPAETATTFNVGMTYIQLPNTYNSDGGVITEQNFPNPCEAGLGGSWEIKDFEGSFFRAEGGESALVFNGGVDIDGDGIVDEYNRGSKQLDQFQGHKHEHTHTYITGSERFDGGSGSANDNVWKHDAYLPTTGVENHQIVGDTINGTPRVGKETRPINYTIRVWQKMLDTGFTCALYKKSYNIKTIEKQVITKDRDGNVLKTEMVVDRVEKTPQMTSSGEVIYKEIASYDREEMLELSKEFASKRQKFIIDNEADDISSKEVSSKVETIIQD